MKLHASIIQSLCELHGTLKKLGVEEIYTVEIDEQNEKFNVEFADENGRDIKLSASF